MRRFIAGLALGVAIIGSSVRAGDPCPIDVKIADLGSPDWLDNLALINALESRQTWVGIGFNTINEGLKLTRVYAGSPAEDAGLMAGDVITAIAGRSALDDEAFASLNIGETVWVSIVRNDEALTLPLTVGGADPVPLAMVQQLHSAECRAPALAPQGGEMQATLMALLFTESRGFRCEDAHIALAPLFERYQSDTVYFVRGSHRLLLTMPYYGTTCIAATALDGENLNEAAASAVIEGVIRNYVRQRHDNP